MKKYLAMGLAMIASSAAMSGSSTSQMQVTAFAPAVCGIEANTLDFSTISANTPQSASSQIGVFCPAGVTFSVTLDAGQNPELLAGLQYPRMANESGDLISYRIAGDDLLLWGDQDKGGIVGGNSRSGTSTGEGTVLFGVVGELLPIENLAAGTYSDTVTITVSF